MIKERKFSVHDDFRTGFFSKLSLTLGVLLLLIYMFLKIFSFLVGKESDNFFGFIYDLANSSFADSVIAFSIMFIGVGIVLYFLHLQFVKLAKIADDFDEELEKLEEKEEVEK